MDYVNREYMRRNNSYDNEPINRANRLFKLTVMCICALISIALTVILEVTRYKYALHIEAPNAINLTIALLMFPVFFVCAQFIITRVTNIDFFDIRLIISMAVFYVAFTVVTLMTNFKFISITNLAILVFGLPLLCGLLMILIFPFLYFKGIRSYFYQSLMTLSWGEYADQYLAITKRGNIKLLQSHGYNIDNSISNQELLRLINEYLNI